MRTSRILHAVDAHTEGMPVRVITGGVGRIPGGTMGSGGSTRSSISTVSAASS